MTAKTITVIFCDTHIGGTTALAPPKFALHVSRCNETNIESANIAQQWLWSNWLDFWRYVYTLTGIRGRIIPPVGGANRIRQSSLLVMVSITKVVESISFNQK